MLSIFVEPGLAAESPTYCQPSDTADDGGDSDWITSEQENELNEQLSKHKDLHNGLGKTAEDLMQKAPLLKARIGSPSQENFSSWRRTLHPTFEPLNKIDDRIIVVNNAFRRPLRLLGLSPRSVSIDQFASMNHANTKVVLIDADACSNESLLVLRRLIFRGARLVTTDMALDAVLRRAFCGFVEWQEGYYSQNGAVYDCIRVSDSELHRGLPSSGQWEVQSRAQIPQVLRPEKVKVISRSRMMREDPSSTGILAFSFEYGRGRILHILGGSEESKFQLVEKARDNDLRLGFPIRFGIVAHFVLGALDDGLSESDNQSF